jgi:hypothetical protein
VAAGLAERSLSCGTLIPFLSRIGEHGGISPAVLLTTVFPTRLLGSSSQRLRASMLNRVK